MNIIRPKTLLGIRVEREEHSKDWLRFYIRRHQVFRIMVTLGEARIVVYRKGIEYAIRTVITLWAFRKGTGFYLFSIRGEGEITKPLVGVMRYEDNDWITGKPSKFKWSVALFGKWHDVGARSAPNG